MKDPKDDPDYEAAMQVHSTRVTREREPFFLELVARGCDVPLPVLNQLLDIADLGVTLTVSDDGLSIIPDRPELLGPFDYALFRFCGPDCIRALGYLAAGRSQIN